MESLEELNKCDDSKHASVYESLVKKVGEFRSILSSTTLMCATNTKNKNDTDNTNTDTNIDNNQFRDNNINLQDSYPNLEPTQKPLLDLFAMLPRGSGLRRNDMHLWWFASALLEVHLAPISKDSNNKESGFERDLSDLLKKKLIEPVMAGVASNLRKNNIREGVRYKMADVIWSQFQESNNESTEYIIEKVNSFTVSKKRSAVNTNGSNLTVERLNMLPTKYMRMLQLGNWNHDPKKYIVVEDAEVLSKFLPFWFLSLEGVSGLVTLPSLPYDKLRVLNLKGCHNLESLPPVFNSLHHNFSDLVYLDVSDCCQLNHTSDAFDSCINLLVVKGFVVPQQPHTIPFISNPSQFERLWKLTLRTRRLKFPTNSDLETLCKLRSLTHLKIEWVGACSAPPDITHDVQFDENAKFPPKINKFEMEAASKGTSTNILNLISRQNESTPIPLKKLYVKGGDLTKLEHGVDCKILRLQYVPKMELNVYDMASSFPKLHRLEMSKDVIYSMLHQSFKIAAATVDSNSHWIPNPFEK